MDNSYKKTFYRATHRGTKELDLIMSRFMNTLFQELTQEQRKQFEIIVNEDDFILESWVKLFYRNEQKKQGGLVERI